MDLSGCSSHVRTMSWFLQTPLQQHPNWPSDKFTQLYSRLACLPIASYMVFWGVLEDEFIPPSVARLYFSLVANQCRECTIWKSCMYLPRHFSDSRSFFDSKVKGPGPGRVCKHSQVAFFGECISKKCGYRFCKYVLKLLPMWWAALPVQNNQIMHQRAPKLSEVSGGSPQTPTVKRDYSIPYPLLHQCLTSHILTKHSLLIGTSYLLTEF